MRLSVSNLAWPGGQPEGVAARLVSAGIEGVEIAPTTLWPATPSVPTEELRSYARKLRRLGLAPSGIQSLMFGHPELQVLQPDTWQGARDHLKSMLTIARDLGAQVAVFGSPRNRLRGALSLDAAHVRFAEFVQPLLASLESMDVTLTIEPNAPDYGADYLTTYEEVLGLCKVIGSPHVRPQVDTGCLAMADDDPVAAIAACPPAHVHVSAPHLVAPPGPIDHAGVRAQLLEAKYDGWIVLEMLAAPDDSLESISMSADWFANAYGDRHH